MIEKSQLSNLWPSIYEPFRALGGRLAEWLSPASEASSDNNAYRIAIELPGVDEKDIELSVHGGVLTVKGEKRLEREEEGDTWFFSERQYGAFQRAFRLPEDADDTKISADLKDGVLTITIPRAKASDGAKSIKIRRAE